MSGYSSYTDQELVALLKQGDDAAFTEIYNRYWYVAYQSSFKIIDDDEACTDVVQDIFVWLWENRELSDIHSLKSYLLTAVKFKMLNLIRQGKMKAAYHDTIVDEADHSQEQNAEVKELMRIIADFAETLPGQARQIFYLSRFEHLSNKEIAQKMGISEKTVKNQINISLKKLRTTLGRMSFWSVFM